MLVYECDFETFSHFQHYHYYHHYIFKKIYYIINRIIFFFFLNSRLCKRTSSLHSDLILEIFWEVLHKHKFDLQCYWPLIYFIEMCLKEHMLDSPKNRKYVKEHKRLQVQKLFTNTDLNYKSRKIRIF